jgi:hypothetical protein
MNREDHSDSDLRLSTRLDQSGNAQWGFYGTCEFLLVAQRDDRVDLYFASAISATSTTRRQTMLRHLHALTNSVSRSEDHEKLSVLYPLPVGPWRSLGKHLDYTNWADRDHFMQLDREI